MSSGVAFILFMFSWCLICQFFVINGCQDLKGIGDTSYDYYSESDLDNVPFTGQLETFLSVVGLTFLQQETPIQGRITMFTGSVIWSVLSSYEEKPLEFFGRVDKSTARRRCETTTESNTQLFKLDRNVAIWYGWYFLTRNYYPSDAPQFAEVLEEFGLDADICDGSKYYSSHCYDTATPWGLSFIIATEYYEYGLNDGWNVDGSYSRVVNKIPYQDFRNESQRYIPKNNPWELSVLDSWQPLLESDELGFLFYQEHVTPHIGYTGKSVVFENDEICERSKRFKRDTARADEYDYNYEIGLLLDRMAELTEASKMEIEFFDAKANLGEFVDQYKYASVPNITSNMFEWWIYDMAYLLNTYETIIVGWKEKVDFDRVRPPSIIAKLLGEQEITTYGGVTAEGETLGTTTFPANNFEAYIRTMPHAEYPSGSACICSAWANAMIQVFGTDDVTSNLPNGLQVSFAAFSSQKEPLSTPSSDITVSYNSFTEAGQRCSDTRLEGGMHFTASVPDSIELCKDIGTKVAQFIQSLANGIKPDYIVDIEDFSLNARDCYPDQDRKSNSRSNSRSSSSSSSSSSGRY